MPTRLSIFCICIALSLFAGARTAPAHPAQDFDNAIDLCADATAHQERVDGIPSHLLRAISLAETGRWDGVEGVNLAWPWTVTEGAGQIIDLRTIGLLLWSAFGFVFHFYVTSKKKPPQKGRLQSPLL
jgi:hypothetical protein